MITLQNIGVQYSGEVLFKNVSLNIGAKERIGLIGANGAGKTTLLRIIMGEKIPDEGTIEVAKFVSVGMLPQEISRLSGITLYDEVATAFEDILECHNKIEQIRGALENNNLSDTDRDELITQMGALQHHLELSGAFSMRSSIEKVLSGLGFRQDQFQWRLEKFSGGWHMRIALAKLLLKQPSLLLLDEPTNHLDLDSLRWLESFLQEYKGSIIIVSHDRAFLDRLTEKTWELSLGELTVYTGNYSAYVSQKEKRSKILQSAFKNQQKQFVQTHRFIERFRYKATKARQVQSRIKQLEKVKRIELEDSESEIHFKFPPPPRSGRVVVELNNLTKRYAEVSVFERVNFTVERGDRIALVGVNGAGKSTLARIIAGVETPTDGERIVGYNVLPAYFAQHQADELDSSLTPFDLLNDIAEGEIRKQIRTLLGCFLFQGDDVFKSIGVLSGGEKSRLALAKMLITPANLFILDEPTNHLDMRSKEILRQALKDFEGTYIIVSHDRAFLQGIVNKVVQVEYGGKLKEYPGTIDDYLGLLDLRKEDAKGEATKTDDKRAQKKDKKRHEAKLRQERYQKMKPLIDKQQQLEREINDLEESVKALEKNLSTPSMYSKPEDIEKISRSYIKEKEKLSKLLDEWENVAVEIEKLSSYYNEIQKRARSNSHS